ncbi:hypothetical protein DY000_02025372 [Brassica cretica]|uniref:Peptidylprolyl isomerase n=1 Tax=Brassica cretica TaxID=69181 RepID=A0ABQ7EI13_BRACR|nr:hypothetical protein DY000_02025372 [Brassica cretica]
MEEQMPSSLLLLRPSESWEVEYKGRLCERLELGADEASFDCSLEAVCGRPIANAQRTIK